MDFAGLQKLTLLDFPGKTACTVFMSGCDMRCPWCHNSQLTEGYVPDLYTQDELFRLLDKRHGLLDGVCLTGGEPLLRAETIELMRAIRDKGFLVKLDTNGTHPERLRAILEEGLADYVAMDIKNSPQNYGRTVGIPDFDMTPVYESAELLMKGTADYEFRTTVIRELHDDDAFLDIGRWIGGARRYFLQAFAQRDTVPDKTLTPPDKDMLLHAQAIMRTFIPETHIRGIDL